MLWGGVTCSDASAISSASIASIGGANPTGLQPDPRSRGQGSENKPEESQASRKTERNQSVYQRLEEE